MKNIELNNEQLTDLTNVLFLQIERLTKSNQSFSPTCKADKDELKRLESLLFIFDAVWQDVNL